MLFLLGPGYPASELERRRRLAHELQELGIKSIVMEDLPQWRSRTLSGKFLDIINDFEPDLFIAIFTRAGRAVGIRLRETMAPAGVRSLPLILPPNVGSIVASPRSTGRSLTPAY